MKKRIYSAVYYERVSTMNDEQTNSMENQRKLCQDFLKKNPEIVLVEPINEFSERVSGKSDQRPKYRKMLERIRQGDIDYILVKDLKRLSRSTEVSARFRTLCKEFGVKLILLATNQIYDPNAEETRMIYGFESLVNEEVVYRQSVYARVAHQQKMSEKRLNRNNCTFGYSYDYTKKDIIINEEEAEIIKEIFDLLVFRDYGCREIRKYLEQKGISVTDRTIRSWLHETAYIGTFHMNKKGSELGVGVGQKTKRFFRPKNQWVPVERPDLAIIDNKIFELAQILMERRRTTYDADKNGLQQDRFRGTHLFSGKVFCEECGKSFVHFYCDRAKSISAYKDSYEMKAHDALSKCKNIQYSRIYEAELEQIALSAVNTFIQENQKCFELVLSVLEESLKNDNSQNKKKQQLEKQIDRLKLNSEKLLKEYLEAEGAIKLGLASKYDELDAQLKQLEQKYADIDTQIPEEVTIAEKIENIKKHLEGMRKFEKIDKDIVDNFIHKIMINNSGEVKVILNTHKMIVYNSPISSWKQQKKERQAQKKEPAFFEKAQIIVVYNKKFYKDVVKMRSRGTREA